MEGTKKIKSMSFHQNSEVETTWISLIGWHHKISSRYQPLEGNETITKLVLWHLTKSFLAHLLSSSWWNLLTLFMIMYMHKIIFDKVCMYMFLFSSVFLHSPFTKIYVFCSKTTPTKLFMIYQFHRSFSTKNLWINSNEIITV